MNENLEQDSGFQAPIGRRKFLALSGGGIAAAILAAC